MLLLALLFSCQNAQESPLDVGNLEVLYPEKTPWQERLDAADLVGAADFDGDGVDERIRFVGEKVFWPGGEMELGGAPQVLRRGTLPEGEHLLVGTGMHRKNRTAPARVYAIGANGPQLLWEERGARNQIADLRIWEGRVYVARFVGQKEIQGGFLVDGQIEKLHEGGLSTQQLPIAENALLVGRVYGEQPRSDGDLRLIRDGRASKLPSLRGVRTLSLANIDGDPELELLVGDGWHYAYGQQALGRVFLLDGTGWSQGRTLAVLDGEYSARSIEASAPLTGENPSTSGLLVTGTKKVHFLVRDGLGWQDRVLGPTTETTNAVLVRTPRGLAAWIAGSPNSRLVGLGN